MVALGKVLFQNRCKNQNLKNHDFSDFLLSKIASKFKKFIQVFRNIGGKWNYDNLIFLCFTRSKFTTPQILQSKWSSAATRVGYLLYLLSIQTKLAS